MTAAFEWHLGYSSSWHVLFLEGLHDIDMNPGFAGMAVVFPAALGLFMAETFMAGSTSSVGELHLRCAPPGVCIG